MLILVPVIFIVFKVSANDPNNESYFPPVLDEFMDSLFEDDIMHLAVYMTIGTERANEIVTKLIGEEGSYIVVDPVPFDTFYDLSFFSERPTGEDIDAFYQWLYNRWGIDLREKHNNT